MSARTRRRASARTPEHASARWIVLLLPLAAACTGIGGPDRPTHARVAADTADQVMSAMHMTLTNLGVKAADVDADSAYLYEGPGRADLKHVTLKFFSTTGIQQSTLTSDEGTYMTRTDSMEARGHVVLVKSDGSKLTTTVLRYNKALNQITTDQPYTYDGPGKHLTGVGFTSDPTMSNFSTNRVHGSGGGFQLPG